MIKVFSSSIAAACRLEKKLMHLLRWDTIMLIQHLREPLQGHHHICAVRFPFQNIFLLNAWPSAAPFDYKYNDFEYIFVFFPLQTFAKVWAKNTLFPRFCPKSAQKAVLKIKRQKPAKPQYSSALAGFALLKFFPHPIYIASPKLKKRYCSATAVLYASKTFSRPAKAETSISRVLSGR